MIEQIYLQLSSLIVSPVHADALGSIITTEVTAASQASDLEGMVQAIINLSIPAGVLAAIFLLSYAGYQMITSQGNPDKLAEAKEVVTNAVLGFALIALSVAILLLIQDTLNLPVA